MTPDQILEGWFRKAQHAASLTDGELLPAWSTSEFLAVGVILQDGDMLAEEGYTELQALERLRYDLHVDTVGEAYEALAGLREQL